MQTDATSRPDHGGQSMTAGPAWLAGIWVLYFLSSVTYLLSNMLSG